MKTAKQYLDRYIQHTENYYICFDERGEYITSAKTRNKARTKIKKYIKERIKNNERVI